MYMSMPRGRETIARLLQYTTYPAPHKVASFWGLTRCVPSITVPSAPSALMCNDVKEESPMALELLVPLSTEVMDQNPECVTGGAYRDGVLMIDLHALQQDHWQRLGVPRETPIHWGPTHTVEVQELSGLSWPIRYCSTTAEGW